MAFIAVRDVVSQIFVDLRSSFRAYTEAVIENTYQNSAAAPFDRHLDDSMSSPIEP